MAITAKELAKNLGISESAVSLALNQKPGVSAKTRSRVIKAAQQAGYDFSRLNPKPLEGAGGSLQFLIFRKNGAVVTDSPFFTTLSEGIDLECKKQEYFLNIQYVYEDSIASTLDTLLKNGTKGIILLGTEMEQADLRPFLDSALPVIMLDNHFEDIDMDSVLIDNIQGAFSATKYLIKKRKTQPGYLRSSYSIHNFEERADGFYKALRKNGMSASRSIVHHLTPSIEGACADMCELLEQKEPVADCYFADNDLIAAGALRAFREYGCRIPRDVAVVGFDDLPLCTYIDPPLSTIHVPKEYMGQMAVRRLIDRIHAPEETVVRIEVSTSLKKRGSV